MISDRTSFHYARWVFLRLLGVIYLIAFCSAWIQITGLVGTKGILPAAAYLQAVKAYAGASHFWAVPTVFWLGAGNGALNFVCGLGVVFSLCVILGIAQPLAIFGLWLLYLSIARVGQVFFAFQWDTLLLETGFLAVFLAPWRLVSRFPGEEPVPKLARWLLWWVLFRLMFESGFVKLASGDPSWHHLTALSYHYMTQPLPNPVSWYAYHLPLGIQKFSTFAALAIELTAPFLIFLFRPGRLAAFGLLVLLQTLILLTGNYGFFNLLTIILCLLLLDDAVLKKVVPRRLKGGVEQKGAGRTPLRRGLARVRFGCTVVYAALVLVVTTGQGSVMASGPASSALPRATAAVRAAVAPFWTINTYGLFAVMTTTRPEIVVEGSRDGRHWKPYAFRYKAGDLSRPPPVVTPHMPRLDWQMWFAALGGSCRSNPWFLAFTRRLLQGDKDVTRLLANDPFRGRPPKYIRSSLYDYRFTSWQQRAKTGHWWTRRPEGFYCPPARLRNSM